MARSKSVRGAVVRISPRSVRCCDMDYVFAIMQRGIGSALMVASNRYSGKKVIEEIGALGIDSRRWRMEIAACSQRRLILSSRSDRQTVKKQR